MCDARSNTCFMTVIVVTSSAQQKEEKHFNCMQSANRMCVAAGFARNKAKVGDLLCFHLSVFKLGCTMCEITSREVADALFLIAGAQLEEVRLVLVPLPCWLLSSISLSRHFALIDRQWLCPIGMQLSSDSRPAGQTSNFVS